MPASVSVHRWFPLGFGLALVWWVGACQATSVPTAAPAAITLTPATVAATLAEPLTSSTGTTPKVIRICDDGAEWPPYTYYRRVGGQKTAEITGYAVDVIAAILTPQGLDFQVELLPWSRCLAEVESGENYQMLLNASDSAERAQKYYLSQPFYTTNSYYFYSKSQHPAGLVVPNQAALQDYQVCGILGYNYTAYGVSAVDDGGVTNYGVLLSKLHAGRCDLFLEKLEIMAGFTVTGEDYLSDPNLGYAPVPGMDSALFYMMFPRTPAGQALRDLVDAGLAQLEQNGMLQMLLKKYVP